ncbi:hypothetical protein QBC42DRAFT_310506 [Cladorrhinum samala]|uniref:Uncharacterized protein n=1 Tax=Cladorrhinum samala TaxID=585594 RepID=A0AAV9I5V4_9PEZI|nr:hypothetical protein QBC42DRAFT_310506 [Cladorrhinum samala]
MSTTSSQSIRSLDSGPSVSLPTAIIASSGLEPVRTSGLDHRILSSNLTFASPSSSSVSLPVCHRPTLFLNSSSTSTIVTLVAFVLVTVMCSIIHQQYACRHRRRSYVFCKDAPIRADRIASGPGTRRKPLPLQGRFRRFRPHSRSPSPPSPRSQPPPPDSQTPDPPSSPRPQSIRMFHRRALCKSTCEMRHPTSAPCFIPECDFERVERCWRCCQCGQGPNRQGRCMKAVVRRVQKDSGDDSSDKKEKCKHEVCNRCEKYVFPPIPIYNVEVRDWVKPPAPIVNFVDTVLLRAENDDGDETESDEEGELTALV